MIRTDISGKSVVVEGFYDLIHIQAATAGQMSPLLKSIVQNLHISQMGEMDSSHGRVFCRQAGYIVLRGTSQRSGTQRDAIVGIVHQL